jgi:hypothetical protein
MCRDHLRARCARRSLPDRTAQPYAKSDSSIACCATALQIRDGGRTKPYRQQDLQPAIVPQDVRKDDRFPCKLVRCINIPPSAASS